MEKKASYKGNKYWLAACVLLLVFSSCSFQQQIAKSAKAEVINNTALQTAHVGISIYDPAANKYLYNYQGDKYFVPASNTKIPTCYAAMKYLGDSLVGLRYEIRIDSEEYSDTLIIAEPTGDPTFLHPEFKNQPVYDFFKRNPYRLDFTMTLDSDNFWGNGWSWNDYQESYMAPRTNFPIYGNLVRIKVITANQFDVKPKYFSNYLYLRENWLADSPKMYRTFSNNYFVYERPVNPNVFELKRSAGKIFEIPFLPQNGLIDALLSDTLQKRTILSSFSNIKGVYKFPSRKNLKPTPIHSQPTDSLLKPMMHRSDNFFAEQSLLMVSNETLGYMNDEKIIDTILKTDFKDLPQKPRWADGSGLSRYNLFTPQDFVAILNKMKNEFGMERLKVIFPTGGEGTISNYYKADSGYIYAKTGTLSGVVAFSGYLYTKKGKLLIFSTLINNHQASATEIRKAIEKFIQGIRNKY